MVTGYLDMVPLCVQRAGGQLAEAAGIADAEAVAELLADPRLQTVGIAYDPVYRRPMTYRAIAIAASRSAGCTKDAPPAFSVSSSDAPAAAPGSKPSMRSKRRLQRTSSGPRR